MSPDKIGTVASGDAGSEQREGRVGSRKESRSQEKREASAENDCAKASMVHLMQSWKCMPMPHSWYSVPNSIYLLFIWSVCLDNTTPSAESKEQAESKSSRLI